MHKFREELLQFIWKHRLLLPRPMITVSGKEVKILNPGTQNADAGPDFSNSRITLGGLTLAGNIELHLKTGDWLKHGHQNDSSYDNIILHAVYQHDVDLNQNLSHNVEVLELKSLISEDTIRTYLDISANKDRLPCSGSLKRTEDIKFLSWLDRMTVERLEEKLLRINMIFERCKGDYVATFYNLLLRNFGFSVNSLPFELLAGQLQVNLLLRHSDDLQILEALLLGSAGMLETQSSGRHIMRLQNEYEFIRKKYDLVPLKRELFKFSKMRPANFPDLRLRQFAALVHSKPGVLSDPFGNTDFYSLKETLRISLNGGQIRNSGTDRPEVTGIGDAAAEGLIINSFAPFLFFYGRKTSRIEYEEHALHLLKACRIENNSKTRMFSSRKDMLRDASHSQGIINLYDNYCIRKLCLRCGIAASMLRA